MELFQNIAVLLIFALAVGYLIVKFVWMPSFLKKKSTSSQSACGSGNCGCN